MPARDRQAVGITGDTGLELGDELLVQTDGGSRTSLDESFAGLASRRRKPGSGGMGRGW